MNLNYKVINDSLKTTEKEAIVYYDFTKPKEYVIYNNADNNTRNGNPRGQYETYALIKSVCEFIPIYYLELLISLGTL